MPKLNNITAALMAVTTFIFPASAGQPGYGYQSGTVYQPAPVQGEMTRGPVNQNIQVARPDMIDGDAVVCLWHGEEVPCEEIPGLPDALRAQGLNAIADRLPVSTYYGAASSYTQVGSPCCVQAAPVAPPAPAPVTRTYRYTTNTYVRPIQSCCAPVNPCVQAVQYTPCAAAPAPVSVRLTDGTVYALNGGVGKGVYGEFYGGGGTVIEGGSRYSGVMSSYASRFTFERKWKKGGWKGGKHPHPKPRYPNPKTRNPHPGKSGCGPAGCGSGAYKGKGY